MPKKMQAYCGLACSECPAYVAKKTNDNALREQTAKKWSSPEYVLLPKDINCDGCKSEGGTRIEFCEQCDIRNCATQKSVETCAHCSHYSCDKSEKVLSSLSPKARQNLERIRYTISQQE